MTPANNSHSEEPVEAPITEPLPEASLNALTGPMETPLEIAEDSDDAWIATMADAYLEAMVNEFADPRTEKCSWVSNLGDASLLTDDFSKHKSALMVHLTTESITQKVSANSSNLMNLTRDPVSQTRQTYHTSINLQVKEKLREIYTKATSSHTDQDTTPPKIGKNSAKENLKSLVCEGKKHLRSCFSRESFNTVFELDKSMDSPEKPVAGPIEAVSAPVQEEISHFSAEVWLDSKAISFEATVPPKNVSINNVYNFGYISPPVEEIKPADPIPLESAKHLSESLKKHANFLLTGVCVAQDTEKRIIKAQTETKPDKNSNDPELAQKATQFVLRLHQEKKDRLRKRTSNILAFSNQGMQSIQQIQSMKAAQERAKHQRLRESIERIHKRQEERNKVNQVSNQLIRMLQMEKNERVYQNTQESTNPPRTDFFYQPLEVVVPPKSLRNSRSKSIKLGAPGKNRDWEGEYQQINQCLAEKISTMEEQLTIMKEKRLDERIRSKHINGLRLTGADTENKTPMKARFSIKKNQKLESIEKPEDSQRKTFRLTSKNSAFKISDSDRKRQAQHHLVARNLNQSALYDSEAFQFAPNNSSLMYKALHTDTLAAPFDFQTNRSGAPQPILHPSILNPWKHRVL